MTDSERRLLLAVAALALAPLNSMVSARVTKLRNDVVAEGMVSSVPLAGAEAPAGIGQSVFLWGDGLHVAVRSPNGVSGVIFDYTLDQARALRDSLNRLLPA